MVSSLYRYVTLYFQAVFILDDIIDVKIDSFSSVTMNLFRGVQNVSRSIFHVHVRLVCLLLIALMMSQKSQSQIATSDSPGISVSVAHQVKIAPSKLRLLLPIRVEARDEASVLETLKNHQETVRKELKGFGADDSAIEFSFPRVTAGVPGVDDIDASRNAARRQIIQMRNMNPTMRGQFPLPMSDDEEDAELPVVYAAESILAVDWNIETESNESIILLPSKVKRLYEQKDLQGKKLRVELTEDEQSLIEPLFASSSFVSSIGPTFDHKMPYFVGEMSHEQEKVATAEAMKKAKLQAELIAQSAGLKLGKIRSIQTSTWGDPVIEAMSVISLRETESLMSTSREKNEREVIGSDSEKLIKRIKFVVVFDFE